MPRQGCDWTQGAMVACQMHLVPLPVRVHFYYFYFFADARITPLDVHVVDGQVHPGIMLSL